MSNPVQNDSTYKVNIFTKEIFYEVRNETYMTGVAAKAADNGAYQSAANMQASDDEQHAYKIQRSIANAINKVKSKLSEYLKDTRKLTNNLIKKAIEEQGKITLEFDLPSNYNEAAFDSLGSAIHDFIVKTAVFDFFTITNPQTAPTYKTLADEALETAKEALYNRSRPVHDSKYYDTSENGSFDPTAGNAGTGG